MATVGSTLQKPEAMASTVPAAGAVNAIEPNDETQPAGVVQTPVVEKVTKLSAPAPAGPVAPAAPGAPAGPAGPAAPVAPVAPAAPVGPAGPIAPAGPVAPVAPAAPVGPAGPVGPSGLVAPVAHLGASAKNGSHIPALGGHQDVAPKGRPAAAASGVLHRKASAEHVARLGPATR